MEKNYRERINTNYATARNYVKNNDVTNAFYYLRALINVARELYSVQQIPEEKAKTFVFLEKWLNVALELTNNGISDTVKQAFSLEAWAKPKPTKIPPPANTVPSDEDLDEYGQGWCATIYSRFSPAVVEFSMRDGATSISGTGFVISEKGYVLTNDHVVHNQYSGKAYDSITISFLGNKTKVPVTIIDTDKKLDVALCSFDPSLVRKVKSVTRIINYGVLKQGADICIIGNAASQGLAPFNGTVRYTCDSDGNLVYTAPSNGGDSGSPVFNRNGKCVGLHKSKTNSINGSPVLGFSNATPMNRINDLLEKWEKKHGFTL